MKTLHSYLGLNKEKKIIVRTPNDELQRAVNILTNADCLTNVLTRGIYIDKIEGIPKKELYCLNSRLSTYVSNRLEYVIIDYLNDTKISKAYNWIRLEGKFPDLQLLHNNKSTGLGIEIKSTYGHCDEPSARFWHSITNFKSYESQYICIIAWELDKDTYGYPIVYNTFCVDAKKLAESRDKGIHKPPDSLLCMPYNISEGNTKQTDVKVYLLQDEESRQSAKKMMEEHNISDQSPWSNESQTLVHTLKNSFKYRIDDNKGKLNRIKHPGLQQFLKDIK